MTLEQGVEGPPVVSMPVSMESLLAEAVVLPANHSCCLWLPPPSKPPVPVLLPEKLSQFIGGVGWDDRA